MVNAILLHDNILMFRSKIQNFHGHMPPYIWNITTDIWDEIGCVYIYIYMAIAQNLVQ